MSISKFIDVARGRRWVAGWCALTLACTILPVAVAEEPPVGADGRSASDLWMEDFLTAAEVISIEAVGEGITSPRRLTLSRDGQVRRAIFKTVDLHSTEVVRTHQIEIDFRDCYRNEVAAYRMDRLLGIGLVPVTVLREVNGERGSVQEWVENVANVRDAMAAPDAGPAGDIELLQIRLAAMYVFDALISNNDRTYDNILVSPQDDRFFLIDHSRSFHTNRKISPPEQGSTVAVQPELAERLRSLDRDLIEQRVGDLLSTAQIRSIVKRRDRLMKVLARDGLVRDQAPS